MVTLLRDRGLNSRLGGSRHNLPSGRIWGWACLSLGTPLSIEHNVSPMKPQTLNPAGPLLLRGPQRRLGLPSCLLPSPPSLLVTIIHVTLSGEPEQTEEKPDQRQVLMLSIGFKR